MLQRAAVVGECVGARVQRRLLDAVQTLCIICAQRHGAGAATKRRKINRIGAIQAKSSRKLTRRPMSAAMHAAADDACELVDGSC